MVYNPHFTIFHVTPGGSDRTLRWLATSSADLGDLGARSGGIGIVELLVPRSVRVVNLLGEILHVYVVGGWPPIS